MISAPITALYAALSGLLILVLAGLVSRHRMQSGIVLGDGGYEPLQRAIRVHGNATEYLPLTLILLLLFEINGGSTVLLHGFGLALIIARVLHAYGLYRTSGNSLGRSVGAGLTWLVILALSLADLVSIL
jgi:uncharacterized membrane protein YecN with MAPEG domain